MNTFFQGVGGASTPTPLSSASPTPSSFSFAQPANAGNSAANSAGNSATAFSAFSAASFSTGLSSNPAPAKTSGAFSFGSVGAAAPIPPLQAPGNVSGFDRALSAPKATPVVPSTGGGATPIASATVSSFSFGEKVTGTPISFGGFNSNVAPIAPQPQQPQPQPGPGQVPPAQAQVPAVPVVASSLAAPAASNFIVNLGAAVPVSAPVPTSAAGGGPAGAGAGGGAAGGGAGAAAAAPTTATAAPAAPAATPALGFSLGGVAAAPPAPAGGAAPAAAGGGGFNLGAAGGFGAPPGPTPPAAGGASGAAAVPDDKSKPSEMFRKTTVKSLLDQWRGDLTSNVQRFNQQAKLAREWEAQLYTNRKLVNKAKHDLSQVDRKQMQMREMLDSVEDYQRSLEATLNQIEHDLEPDLSSSAHRENLESRGLCYEPVERLQHRITKMEADLNALAEEFNRSRGGADDMVIGAADSSVTTVAQTVEILNRQFEMLSELDARARQLEGMVGTVIPELQAARGGRGM